MMRRLIVVVLGLFVAISAAIPASAATDVDAIIGALKEAPVYIAQGTEGTTPDTAATLTSKLRENDNIVLVILPADSTLTQEQVDALALKISNGLKNEKTVGIAVGAQFSGASSIMPSGTANDLMDRADTVSTNSVETLGTFVRNVHDWQTSNPDYLPTPKPAKAEAAIPVWPFVVGGGIALAVIVLFVISVSTRHRIRGRVHYTAPGDLNDPVRTMMSLRSRLNKEIYWDDFNPESNRARRESVERMSVAIDKLCRYTEAYFKRFTAEKRNSETVGIFSKQLEQAQTVVEQYAYAYEDHEFVEEPLALMRQGHEAIEGLAEVMLSSIKRGNNDLLMDFKIITGIIDAQRYKSPKSRR